MSKSQKFDLPTDGIHGSQVLVYDEDDLDYWREKSKAAGMIMAYSFHVPYGALIPFERSHDVYQVIPSKEL